MASCRFDFAECRPSQSVTIGNCGDRGAPSYKTPIVAGATLTRTGRLRPQVRFCPQDGRSSRSCLDPYPTPWSWRGRQKRPIADRRPVILHVGTADYKNPGASLRAFAAARLDEACELVITGRPTEALEAEVAALPIKSQGRVRLVGHVPTEAFLELLGTCMLFVVPSTYRTPVFSPTVLEAFAAGTPVIASSVSADLINGRNGVALAPGFSEDELRRDARILDQHRCMESGI